jgi:hypothetical protein
MRRASKARRGLFGRGGVCFKRRFGETVKNRYRLKSSRSRRRQKR